MRLSPEQFAELAASFPGYAHDRERRERRRASRLELCAQLVIRVLYSDNAATPTTVTVSNFSQRGLALLMHEPLETGTQFVTELARKGGGHVGFLCTVKHSCAVPNGLYQVGAEFTRVLHRPLVELPVEQIADELRRLRETDQN